MYLTIRPEQYRALEDHKLLAFAAEALSTLTPIVADRQAASAGPVTKESAFEQLKRAEEHGLKRRNEMMAWMLCVLVHGPDFDQALPPVRRILADRNYDRAVLLTQLAIEGLQGRTAR